MAWSHSAYMRWSRWPVLLVSAADHRVPRQRPTAGAPPTPRTLQRQRSSGNWCCALAWLLAAIPLAGSAHAPLCSSNQRWRLVATAIAGQGNRSELMTRWRWESQWRSWLAPAGGPRRTDNGELMTWPARRLCRRIGIARVAPGQTVWVKGRGVQPPGSGSALEYCRRSWRVPGLDPVDGKSRRNRCSIRRSSSRRFQPPLNAGGRTSSRCRAWHRPPRAYAPSGVCSRSAFDVPRARAQLRRRLAPAGARRRY